MKEPKVPNLKSKKKEIGSTNDFEILDLLLSNDNFNPEESNINFAFYISDIETMKHLITIKSLDVNYVPFQNNLIYINDILKKQTVQTPLLKAINGNDIDLFELIINHQSFEKDELQLEIARRLAFNRNSEEFNIDINSPILTFNRMDVVSPLCAAVLLNFNTDCISEILNHPKFDSRKSDIANTLLIRNSRVTIDLIYDFDC